MSRRWSPPLAAVIRPHGGQALSPARARRALAAVTRWLERAAQLMFCGGHPVVTARSPRHPRHSASLKKFISCPWRRKLGRRCPATVAGNPSAPPGGTDGLPRGRPGDRLPGFSLHSQRMRFSRLRRRWERAQAWAQTCALQAARPHDFQISIAVVTSRQVPTSPSGSASSQPGRTQVIPASSQWAQDWRVRLTALTALTALTDSQSE